MPKHWFFFFVPGFTLCLMIINQAKYRQWPVMMVISFGGYLVNYFSSTYFNGNSQVSNALGALTIGVMANLYSRVGRSFDNSILDLWEDKLRPLLHRYRRRALAARRRHRRSSLQGHDPNSTEPMPFSSSSDSASEHYTPHKRRLGYGLAAAAMLPAIFVQVPSGLAVQGSLISGISSADQITRNDTSTGPTVVTPSNANTAVLNSTAFNVGYSVIQVAIGITVGLFLSALVVYPRGKRRSGLFSF